MKCLYSKLAAGRKKEYQIITNIVLENGEKWVQKKAACEEAKSHIVNTYHNEELMAPIYGDYLLRGRLEDCQLITPFVAGESLGSRLRECIKTQNNEALVLLLRQWKNLIAGNQSNICKFAPSKEFELIFGNGSDLIGVNASMISNFDCSAENIFYTQEDGIKIIDYEWVFPFSIPIELSFYRALKMFFACNQGLIDWKTLLDLAEIDQKYCHSYELMTDAFAAYVYIDKERDINYSLMGEKFKTGRVLERNREAFQYRFPYHLVPEGKRIILYGAGNVGEEFNRLLKLTNYCQIAAWTDKRAELYRKQNLPVVDINEIVNCTYDYVLVAVYQEKVAEEIREELKRYGVESEKIVWGKPQML